MKFILLLILCSQFLFSEECKEEKERFTVLELFTSEGCSSCPSAEKFLNELSSKDTKNIFPLEFHVTYWDYLGWKDPYAQKQFTERQNFYAAKKLFSSIYTPQLYLNGKKDFVGSNRTHILKEMEREMAIKTFQSILVNSNLVGSNIETDYKINCSLGEEWIHFAIVQKKIISKVTKGENAGELLKHESVVRKLVTLDAKDKGKLSISLKGLEENLDDLTMIVYTQNKQSLEITQATRKQIR
ncbi:MAG: DUF1223 domain-containing protein [Leptospiraceae bacterium]|nr:DUF1223 domain-containing protein [Leptospiraceae bacterium]